MSTASSSPDTVVPNGPKSTATPDRSAASTAARTCGPGSPSTNGSMVNSTIKRHGAHPASAFR